MPDFLAVTLPVLLCLLLGEGLFVVEALMPGFGVAGICGILLNLAAVVIAYKGMGLVAAILVLLLAVLLGCLAAWLALRSLRKGKFSSMALNETEKADDGEETPVRPGDKGTAVTILRPTGMAEFGGRRVNVMTDGVFIEKDEPIRVISAAGSRILVEKDETSVREEN